MEENNINRYQQIVHGLKLFAALKACNKILQLRDKNNTTLILYTLDPYTEISFSWMTLLHQSELINNVQRENLLSLEFDVSRADIV